VLKHELRAIIPIDPGKDNKISRVNACTGMLEAGNVYLPKYAAFTDGFINECAEFPNGAHDDAVDSCTQFLNKYKFYKADVAADDGRSEFDKQLAAYKKQKLGGGRGFKKGRIW
ncbi:MAG: phage terminase large subunit, partial [Oscillospiraceae bacterium]|nr:phage terminase large subunit [Oscillospiraceae bacterium]